VMRALGQPEAEKQEAKLAPWRGRPEADGSARSRSTSAGSSSPGSDDTVSDESATPAATPLAELPHFDYPAPLFVRNTFLDTGLDRPASLEGFFRERELRSCPASALGWPAACEDEEADEVDEAAAGGARRPRARVLPATGHCITGSAAGAPEPPGRTVLPPPPTESPLLPPAARLSAEPPAAPPAAAAPAPMLLLSEALPPALGFPELRTVGSMAHGQGCSPCAHAHSSKGCLNGAQCAFCHLCPPGELKRRQKAKRLAQRTELRATGIPRVSA